MESKLWVSSEAEYPSVGKYKEVVLNRHCGPPRHMCEKPKHKLIGLFECPSDGKIMYVPENQKSSKAINEPNLSPLPHRHKEAPRRRDRGERPVGYSHYVLVKFRGTASV